jgi:hypothetical protein
MPPAGGRRPPLVGDVDAGHTPSAQLFCSWKKQQICIYGGRRSRACEEEYASDLYIWREKIKSLYGGPKLFGDYLLGM